MRKRKKKIVRMLRGIINTRRTNERTWTRLRKMSVRLKLVK